VLFYLIKSRESVFHKEKRIYHKLVVLVLETMSVYSTVKPRPSLTSRLPPVICILILDADGSKASPTGTPFFQ
jgi:hypothetical protein